MSLDVPPEYAPPPPPPKKIVRPKITLQIPDAATPARGPPTGASVYWAPHRYHGRVGGTPASHISDPQNPYFNPFLHMYHNKASDFMFKQFEGFKDFTMNTAKSGLSAGEKSAFWFYNKLRLWSKKWFTHLFLTICLVLYSFMGAAMFMALEGYKEYDICEGRRAQKTYKFSELFSVCCSYFCFIVGHSIPLMFYFSLGIVYLFTQIAFCIMFCG